MAMLDLAAVIKTNQYNYMQRIYFLLLVLVVSGCASAPTVDSLQQWRSNEERLDTVARNILARNIGLCPEQRKDYGFRAMWLTQENAEGNQVFEEAYGIQEIPTIVTIIPDAAFDHAGVHVGDAITSVNGNKWSTSKEDKSKLIEELNAAQSSSSMHLTVRRNSPKETEEEVLVTGDDICDAYVVLVNDSGTYAYAQDRSAYIEAGLMELLPDDNEVAFIVAHEIAHVLLKHVVPGSEEALNDNDIRSAIEKEADEMAIRLMIGAEYNPVAATTVIRKIDYENRGPITRLLGLYGPYMPTEQRIDFLKSCAAEVGKE